PAWRPKPPLPRAESPRRGSGPLPCRLSSFVGPCHTLERHHQIRSVRLRRRLVSHWRLSSQYLPPDPERRVRPQPVAPRALNARADARAGAVARFPPQQALPARPLLVRGTRGAGPDSRLRDVLEPSRGEERRHVAAEPRRDAQAGGGGHEHLDVGDASAV